MRSLEVRAGLLLQHGRYHVTAGSHVTREEVGVSQETTAETKLAVIPDLGVVREVTLGLTHETSVAATGTEGVVGAHVVQMKGGEVDRGEKRGVDREVDQGAELEVGADLGRFSDVLAPEKCTEKPTNLAPQFQEVRKSLRTRDHLTGDGMSLKVTEVERSLGGHSPTLRE